MKGKVFSCWADALLFNTDSYLLKISIRIKENQAAVRALYGAKDELVRQSRQGFFLLSEEVEGQLLFNTDSFVKMMIRSITFLTFSFFKFKQHRLQLKPNNFAIDSSYPVQLFDCLQTPKGGVPHLVMSLKRSCALELSFP
jgi:hypothetical protein